MHLYNEDGDVLYATPDLLSVHTVSGGERSFELPKQVEVVYDLFNNRLLGRDAAQFCVAAGAGLHGPVLHRQGRYAQFTADLLG